VYDWQTQHHQVPDPNDPNVLIWMADWSDTPTSHTRLVYDGWRVILELDGLVDNRVLRKFTWCLDISGSLEGAGGIGGLQAIVDLDDPNDPNDLHGQFVACYDGLGNLTQLIDWESAMTAGSFDPSTHIAAHYEYSPYGQVVRQTGSYAAENPFRFSTKWFDDETRLGYWGYRYYIPEQGRWLNRDPIGEEGGVNP
jgi:RHS repeat-associated protein